MEAACVIAGTDLINILLGAHNLAPKLYSRTICEKDRSRRGKVPRSVRGNRYKTGAKCLMEQLAESRANRGFAYQNQEEELP